MAINFETVAGNQTSANVLAQINNNFAKINSNPVPKADFATNADTVDNKHASELIPGAATFLNSITSLANLSIGRYFCTQTRQSWEPVTTTGSRTFLIEVSLDTPNSLKSYKINYIAGAGAGESYYSDYSSGSIRWNRVMNNNNIGTITAVRDTYDNQDRSGRVVTYDEMMVFQEGDTLIPDDFININNGSGNYYKVSGTLTYDRTSGSGCSSQNIWKMKISVGVYNSNFNLIRTITSSEEEISFRYGNNTYTGSVLICGQYINESTGDLMICAIPGIYYNSSNEYYTVKNGYYYLSAATNSIMYIPINNYTVVTSNYCGGGSSVQPSYWYNNHFGILDRGSTNSSSSAYSNIQMYYVELNDNRNSVVVNNSMTIAGNAYSHTQIGQKGQYYYICTNTSSYTSNPSLVRINITTRSAQSVSINIASTTSSAATPYGAMMDDDFIYVCIRYQTSSSNYYYKIVKYNDDLVLAATSPQFINEYSCYLILTDNYVLAYNSSSSTTSSPSKCFNKSNLSLVSSYQKYFYFTNVYNPSSVVGKRVVWFDQTLRNVYVYGLYLTGNYVLEGNATSFYTGGPYSSSSSSSTYQTYYLFPIINVATGSIVGYFANALIYNKRNDSFPIYIDGIGLYFRGKKLITSNINYLLKSYKLN